MLLLTPPEEGPMEPTIGLCPVYGADILPDEENRCSLCGAPNQHQDDEPNT